MKAPVVVLLLIFVALAGANWLQLQQVRHDLARLERAIAPVSAADARVGDPMAAATRALGRAHQALADADPAAARRALAEARQHIDKVSERAGPAAKWLREQATDLGRQIGGLAQQPDGLHPPGGAGHGER